LRVINEDLWKMSRSQAILNGCFSVIGPPLATVAVQTGFRMVYLLAAAAYFPAYAVAGRAELLEIKISRQVQALVILCRAVSVKYRAKRKNSGSGLTS
jgi:hypothetical protein